MTLLETLICACLPPLCYMAVLDQVLWARGYTLPVQRRLFHWPKTF